MLGQKRRLHRAYLEICPRLHHGSTLPWDAAPAFVPKALLIAGEGNLLRASLCTLRLKASLICGYLRLLLSSHLVLYSSRKVVGKAAKAKVITGKTTNRRRGNLRGEDACAGMTQFQ